MHNVLKEKELKDLVTYFNKCDYYLLNLNEGNIRCLNETINFSNKKYKEFCIKDAEVALFNTNFIPTGLDDVSQTIQNLIALKN